MRSRQLIKILVLAVLMGGLFAGTAIARGPSNVWATVHNLSTSGPGINPLNPSWVGFPTYPEGTEDRICVFCHIPHAGELNTPLWNRDITTLQGKTYTHYDSATLSSVIKGDVNRTVNNESLLCLSCHDGSIAVGDIVNASNGTPDLATAFILGISGIPGPQIGASPGNVGSGNTADLTDDHPISFSYSAVQTVKSLEFVDVASVDPDLRFYGAQNRLECGTCHDPHVDYKANPAYDPFLAKSNANSALCLSCHIK